jgi:Zn-dependent protease
MSLETILFILIVLMSVVIHEVSHGFAADRLGDPTARYAGRLTLNPLPHLDPIGSFLVPLISILSFGVGFGWAKPVPYNPYNISSKYGDALVAGAGPLSNILIALIAGIVLRFGLVSVGLIPLFDAILTINLVLALFNLMPVPPLDGSKILGNFLPYDMRERFMSFGTFGFAFVILAIFVLWPFISPLVFVLRSLILGL